MINLDEIAFDFVDGKFIYECDNIIKKLSEKEISDYLHDNYPDEVFVKEDIEYLKDGIIEQAKYHKRVIQEEKIEELKEEICSILKDYDYLGDIQIVKALVEISNDYLYEIN